MVRIPSLHLSPPLLSLPLLVSLLSALSQEWLCGGEGSSNSSGQTSSPSLFLKEYLVGAGKEGQPNPVRANWTGTWIPLTTHISQTGLDREVGDDASLSTDRKGWQGFLPSSGLKDPNCCFCCIIRNGVQSYHCTASWVEPVCVCKHFARFVGWNLGTFGIYYFSTYYLILSCDNTIDFFLVGVCACTGWLFIALELTFWIYSLDFHFPF